MINVQKILMFIGVLLVIIGVSSCRTQYVVMPSSHTRDSTHLTTDRRIDSTFYFVHDSMSIRLGKVSSAGGNGIPDTVYVDRWHTIFKDRWHTLSHTDTITVTRIDTVSVAIPCPSWGKGADRRERGYIPRFYRTCTLGFFLLLIAIITFIALRFYLHR